MSNKGIKAIETEYNGYKFRSRLEARWAVFFGELGVEYEYEPEGFNLNGVYYLPDFRLRHIQGRTGANNCDGVVYVEVKGELTTADAQKLDKIPCPILCVGDIPYGKDSYEIWDKVWNEHDKDYHFYGFENIDGDCYCAMFVETETKDVALAGPDNDFIGQISPRIVKALLKARQARFEHGETPKGVSQ